MRQPTGRTRRPIDRALLLLGAAGVAAGTLLGRDARLLEVVVSPPAILRSALVGVSIVLALRLLACAVVRIRHGREAGDGAAGEIIRGVRFVFLGVAAFAAALGWLVASPLPLVLALVIAGIDVVETTFLLVIVGARRGRVPRA